MAIGRKRYSRDLLPRDHARALRDAGRSLIDRWCADLALLDRGASFQETTMSADLPRRALGYDVSLARRFFVCLVTVMTKLESSRDERLACTAEELALNALISRAEVLLDAEELPHDFAAFRKTAFEDLDYLWLFGGAPEGIEASFFGTLLGLTNLAASDWFEPFNKRAAYRVHPYVESLAETPERGR